MGAKQDVFVETLVMRGTLEEGLLQEGNLISQPQQAQRGLLRTRPRKYSLESRATRNRLLLSLRPTGAAM
jgi:hypothetical protein